MPEIKLLIKKLHPEAIVPIYRRAGDSGFDLHAVQDTIIPPGSVALVPTGLAVAVPDGYELQIRMRSGAALKTPLIVANAPGTVDSGYRGELFIITRNTGQEPWLVAKGERIAQGVVAPVMRAEMLVVDELPPSERGSGAFGSTGNGA